MLPGELETLGPIQIIPQGLMGLLQLKQTGKLPGWLATSVQPTIDLRDWYMNSRRLDEFSLPIQTKTGSVTTGLGKGVYAMSTGGAAGAVGANVPQNQMWFVDWWTVQASMDAAASVVTFAPTLGSAGSLTVVPLANAVTFGGGARVIDAWVVANPGRPFWAGPGDQFMVWVADVSSVGGIVFTVHMRVTVLPI